MPGDPLQDLRRVAHHPGSAGLLSPADAQFALDEICRLQAENARLTKLAYFTIRKPRWWPRG